VVDSGVEGCQDTCTDGEVAAHYSDEGDGIVRRTQATDCRTLPYPVPEVFAALTDFGNYPTWWPKELSLKVLHLAPDHVGSRLGAGLLGGWFICEVTEVVPEREVRTRYIEGVHRGEGVWSLEPVEGDTKVCYRIDLEPQGVGPRLLSHVLDFGHLHSKLMGRVFDGLERFLGRKG
jgi:ribosome-associated toxin RatA of RatAB toxin-antitoxin module